MASRHFRDGTGRKDRFPVALAPEYAPVDNRSYQELLAFPLKFAPEINYYSQATGKVYGDWADFFQNDPEIRIAWLLETNPTDLREVFQEMSLKVIRGESYGLKLAALLELHAWLFGYADQLYDFEDDGIAAGRGQDSRMHGWQQLKPSIDYALRQLMAVEYRYFAPSRDALELKFAEFGIQTDADTVAREIWQEAVDEISEDVRPGLDLLDEAFERVFRVISKMRTRASSFLKLPFAENQQRDPHLGLYIAFIKLFRHAQNQLNGITGRHLEHYYTRVLQLQPGKGRADTVNLVLQLARETASFILPEGTRFDGGKDEEGRAIVFRSDREVVLNHAALANVRSLHLASHLAESEAASTHIYAAPFADSADGLGTPLPEDAPGWRAFGRDQMGINPTERNMAAARIGFQLASPMLRLQEGTRKLRLNFRIRAAAYRHFSEQVRSFGPDNFSLQEIFCETFGPRLTVEITTAEGWFTIPTEQISVEMPEAGEAEDVITLRLAFSEFDPALNALSPDLDLAAASFETPMLRILADVSTDGPSPYDALRALVIDELDIACQVLGMRQIQVRNDFALLDPSVPFQPFGSTPLVGSSLYVGHEELLTKDVTQMRMNLEWMDLPDAAGGLPEYYDAYGYVESNSDFQGRISRKMGSQWVPGAEADQQSIAFFRSSRTSYPAVKPGCAIEVITEKLPVPLEKMDAAQLGERGFIPDGMYRVQLATPSQAFGHKMYPNLIADTVTYNTVKKRKKDPERPLPNEPWTPTLSSISVDYSAQQKVRMGDLPAGAAVKTRFFSLEPFGEVEMQRGGVAFHPFPQYTGASHFYLGIEGLTPPQNLSLLFRMVEGTEDFDMPRPELKWEYLANNSWKPLEGDMRLFDSTHELAGTGISVFDIPGDAAPGPSMGDALHWLRAVVPHGHEAFPDMREILAQAVPASLETEGEAPAFRDAPIPEGSVAGLVKPSREVAGVLQPEPSLGSRGPESQARFYTRVSERLRHKGRALSAWDYERLVLEGFSEIYKVKCLPHMTQNSMAAEGHVTVVVIPHPELAGGRPVMRPRLGRGRLADIQGYLEGKTSSHVRLAVRNASFEEVRVKALIGFHHGIDKARYLRELNAALVDQLAPWRTGGDGLEFGRTLRCADLLWFIEQQSYVDNVQNFRLQHLIDGEVVAEADLSPDGSSELSPMTPWSIFVSAETHLLLLAEPGAVTVDFPEEADGISVMALADDFIVGAPEEAPPRAAPVEREERGGVTPEDLRFLVVWIPEENM